MNNNHLPTEMLNLHSSIVSIEGLISKNTTKNYIIKTIFIEYVKIFSKLHDKLILLSNRINQQILNTQSKNQESIDQSQQSLSLMFQHLSNSLLRTATISKNLSSKGKNQIVDPMKIFSQNYQTLNNEQLNKLKSYQSNLMESYFNLQKSQNQYLSAQQKLQYSRKNQSKVLTKIQNGDLQQLERYNNSIKKMTEAIKIGQQKYNQSVNSVNQNFINLRSQIKQITISLSHNQQSRICFTKKSVVHGIRFLQQLKNSYDSQTTEKKIQQSLKMSQKPISSQSNIFFKKLNHINKSQYLQQFISYQQLQKQKRKKILQEQNIQLNQYFNKIPQIDKKIIKSMIKSWFQNSNISSSQTKKIKNRKSSQVINLDQIDIQQIQQIKLKIISNLSYSYYFIHIIHMTISQMSNFYAKLSQQTFNYLLNTFKTITRNLQSCKGNQQLCVQFNYKMIQISMRVMIKKTIRNKSQPIQLLSHAYGRTPSLQNQITLKKIFLYLRKKKITKKSNSLQNNASKGVMDSFMKATGIRKKQSNLTDQQNFGCITQITQIMANLFIPTQISLPFIKSLLPKNQNIQSFQYLKSLLLQKKDIRQRQKIFYQTQIISKKQNLLNSLKNQQQKACFCIKQTAKSGFLSTKDLKIRQVHSSLKLVHQQILLHLNLPSSSWIHLIPYNYKLDYIQSKTKIAQNSVPSAVQQIITLDVNRSLHNHGQKLPPTLLHSLLRLYAYNHPQISYCQGMNYIAGYLYLKMNSQQQGYRAFQYLMDTRFKQLFLDQFHILKLKMYQFQRLLSVFMPQISQHFKKQCISPQCYIVGWIITLFASSYQYTQQSHLIDVLWKRFIIYGWSVFYQFVLALFYMFKQQLLQLTYDKALHFLGQMGRSQMFMAPSQQFQQGKKWAHIKIQQHMQMYPITQQLLQTFSQQYKINQ